MRRQYSRLMPHSVIYTVACAYSYVYHALVRNRGGFLILGPFSRPPSLTFRDVFFYLVSTVVLSACAALSLGLTGAALTTDSYRPRHSACELSIAIVHGNMGRGRIYSKITSSNLNITTVSRQRGRCGRRLEQ